MDIEKVDYLVIGGGVAGLSAAIELAASNADVLVLTKDMPTESSSEYAQGGVAVAMSDEDEVGIHYEDTLRAGDGLCDERAVKVLVEEGPRRIQKLIEWGAEFDREGTRLAFTLEAAHSRRRILHAHGDATGRELVRVLAGKAMSFKNVRRYPFTTVIDLIAQGGECIGAMVIKERKTMAIAARAVILATGGGGQIYSITTNPPVATADGMAVADRAGAVLKDMEFVQFHPTSLYHPLAPNFLLSEAMRGEGGRLLNINNAQFMSNYHASAELAPRDVVSRAIISETVKTNSRHVYLDMRHLDAEFLKRRFPKIYSTCLKFGIDITADLIPVSPAAHYMMGGVATDINGLTVIRNLYAAGETACTGIHGANRLASNSLLEGIVFGARAGASAASASRGEIDINSAQKAGDAFSAQVAHTITDHDEIRGNLRRLMWDKVGIIRCGKSLTGALDRLDAWRYILEKTYMTRREIELKNMLSVAIRITEAALKRTDNRGAHFRTDAVNGGR